MTEAEPMQALIVVAGSPGIGKSSLLRRLRERVFPVGTSRTVGLLDDPVRVFFSPSDEHLSEELLGMLPQGGLELELVEVAGRETHARTVPRGRQPRGLLVCYDCTDRSSFLCSATTLCKHRLDWHLADSKAEIWTRIPGEPPANVRLVSILCGLKADLLKEQGARPAATEKDVQDFVASHTMEGATQVSARNNIGVFDVLQMIAEAVLRAARNDALTRAEAAQADWAPLSPAAEAWTLPCDDTAIAVGPMTSPRGVRPHEPLRPSPKCREGQAAARLLEVMDGDGNTLCAPRTLECCLERGLLHRSVHLWLHLPRAGGLLVRRRAQTDLKDPNRWGPTIHGEVLCYGHGGEGHAAELSRQAVIRCLGEQLGLQEDHIGELDHRFSTRASRLFPGGRCKEIIDVYTAPITGQGLPPLQLQPEEKVEWAYFGDVLGEAAAEADTVCYMEAEYKRTFSRQLQALVVQADMEHAFGKGTLLRLESCRPKTHMKRVVN